MELTPSQGRAIATLTAKIDEGQELLSLSGPAGTGKTTLISTLLEIYPHAVLCTPTNKAAQVLQSKGMAAETFFKTFYVFEEKQPGQRLRFTPCDQYAALGLKLPPGKVDHAELLIIDEASMVTSRQLKEMRRMADQVLLVGDQHQLPPVGDKDYPAGFFCQRKHDATLTEVMRNGGMILQLATEIRENTPKVNRALAYFEPQDKFDSWVQRGAQMIAFTNKERQRINHVCRKLLGFTEPYPMPGDKVMITNNFSEMLINGTEAIVQEFEWDGVSQEALIRVTARDVTQTCKMAMKPFILDQIQSQQRRLREGGWEESYADLEDCLELTFGNCITAHKAQGSEWDSVLVFDQRGLIRKISEGNPRNGMSGDEYARRWIYTAVTRARNELGVAPTWFAQSYQMDEVAA